MTGLAFEIGLTAAFLSTAGRGEWDNWAIGRNMKFLNEYPPFF